MRKAPIPEVESLPHKENMAHVAEVGALVIDFMASSPVASVVEPSGLAPKVPLKRVPVLSLLDIT